MYLIEMFKNYKSKRKLREENFQLSERNNMLELELKRQCFKPIHMIDSLNEKKIHTLKISCVVGWEPVDHIKREIAEGLFEQIESAIEYDLHDESVGKVYTGTLCVVMGDTKYE